jgi:peptidoglycan L-alanyl-D-glutamate endopeptidase CwlK
MRKYSNRSLRNLKGIHPDLRRVIDRALQDSPLDFIVIEGLRTKDRQAKLVASGASQTMNSRHITGHAVDLLPIGPNGAAFDWPLYHKLGPAVKAAARAEGVELEWGGDWRTFKDGPHFQLSHEAYPASQWTTGDVYAERTLSDSRTVQGGAVAGAGTAGTAVTDLIQQTQTELSGIMQYVPALQWVFVALALAGIGFAIYARIDDWKAGHK